MYIFLLFEGETKGKIILLSKWCEKEGNNYSITSINFSEKYGRNYKISYNFKMFQQLQFICFHFFLRALCFLFSTFSFFSLHSFVLYHLFLMISLKYHPLYGFRKDFLWAKKLNLDKISYGLIEMPHKFSLQNFPSSSVCLFRRH